MSDERISERVDRNQVAKWLRDAPAVTPSAFLKAFPARDARSEDDGRFGRDRLGGPINHRRVPQDEDHEALRLVLHDMDMGNYATAYDRVRLLIEFPVRGEDHGDCPLHGDAAHPDWQDYVATNLLDALSLVPNSGDWWGALKGWAERHSSGRIKPNRVPQGEDHEPMKLARDARKRGER